MLSLRFIFLTLCLVLGISRLSWADGPAVSRDIITIPYEKTGGGLMLVSVTINKTTNARFLLDTGTNQCFLSDHLGDKLKLVRSPAVLKSGKPNLNNGVPYDKVQIVDMAMGSFHVNGDFGVIDRKQFDLEQNGAEGIIGVNVLMDKAVALYPVQHLLYIYVSGNLSADEATVAGFGPAAYRSLMVWDPASAIYRCPVTVAGPHGVSDYAPILDTGADKTNISSDVADTVGLVPFGVNQSTMFNRQFSNSAAHVTSLKLGDLQVFNLPVNFTRVKPEPNRSLGMDVLGGYNVLMDFPASKLYLCLPSVAPTKQGASR